MENHRENKQQYRVKEQFDFVKQEVIRRDGDRREKNTVSERASERVSRRTKANSAYAAGSLILRNEIAKLISRAFIRIVSIE